MLDNADHRPMTDRPQSCKLVWHYGARETIRTKKGCAAGRPEEGQSRVRIGLISSVLLVAYTGVWGSRYTCLGASCMDILFEYDSTPILPPGPRKVCAHPKTRTQAGATTFIHRPLCNGSLRPDARDNPLQSRFDDHATYNHLG